MSAPEQGADTVTRHKQSDQGQTLPTPPHYHRLFTRENWMNNAACRNHPKNWWFPTEGQYESKETRTARAICQDCAVKQQCGDYATNNNELYGIWGGKSAHERAAQRRAARPPRQPRKVSERSPASYAIIDALADGRWHTYDELVAIIAVHVTEERALTRYNKIARLRNTPEKTEPDTESVTLGRRRILTDLCHNLYQDKIVDRDSGKVRLTGDALSNYHRDRNEGDR